MTYPLSQTKSITLSTGATALSGVTNLEDFIYAGLETCTAWSAAVVNLSMRVGQTTGSLRELNNSTGGVTRVGGVEASKSFDLGSILAPFKYVQFRGEGTTFGAGASTASRTLKLHLKR